MDELIARLEKATGPDRALDDAIADFLFGKPQTLLGSGAKPYTFSIDAALTLVPERAVWMVQIDYELPGRAHINTEIGLPGYWARPANFEADGATPAIAICIAALKARAEIQ